MGKHVTKINDEFIDALEEIVSDPYFYIWKNEDLLDAINERMGEEYLKIDTLKSYLTGRRGKHTERYERFAKVIRKALLRQKINLVDKLESEDKAWQKYAWLLERKFEDFNKIERNENDNKHQGEVTITRKVIK